MAREINGRQYILHYQSFCNPLTAEFVRTHPYEEVRGLIMANLMGQNLDDRWTDIEDVVNDGKIIV